MTQLVLDCSEDDARILIKGAFERTKGIKQYHEEGRQIVGKTGLSLGSYGEKIYVDISESPKRNQTPIEITAEKEVEVNGTANAEKYKRRFIDEIGSLRKFPIEQVYQMLQRDMSSGTKEVTSRSGLRNGSDMVAVVMISTFIAFILLMFIMIL
jgi:hypothetical protein